MLYLNDTHIEAISPPWETLLTVIEKAASCLENKDYAQPVKPYLRYGDTKNRIIAMPAYIGGNEPLSGIKWIASFPDNIRHHLPRAHAVTVLNEAGTGVPVCMINTGRISAVRTAAVSGAVIKAFGRKPGPLEKYTIGIIGFGPIGRMHLGMINEILKDRIEEIFLFDLKTIDKAAIPLPVGTKVKLTIADSWEDVYRRSDIFITCTVADMPYINSAPRKGSLQLNVSLRDYTTDTRQFMDVIAVDDWEEVCRQNTDIENMHKINGLQKEDTITITDILCKDALQQYPADNVVMFNPMGMAVFDIAIGGYYYRKALEMNTGVSLKD